MKLEGFTLSRMWTSITLMVCCILFFMPLERRKRARLRAALFVAAGVTASVTLGRFVPQAGLLDLTCYYLLSSLFFLFCGELKLPEAMYCGIWALVVQQVGTELMRLLQNNLHTLPGFSARMGEWIGLAVGLLFYAVVGLTIARWMPHKGHYDVGPRQFISALFLLLIFELLFNMMFSTQYQPVEGGRMANMLLLLLVQCYCVTVLYLQNELFKKSALRHELETLDRLWHQQKEQYSLAKENIALINRKCHDLKHQVAAMRTIAGPEEREKYLREVEDSVRIYEAIVQTGNEVLDTVLTEKSLSCEAKRIKVNCVADGSSLGFMDPVDLYAIFGNALDNAIESVKDFEDPGMRFIDVQVYTERQFLIIHVTNPLRHSLTFRDGLPVSTKPKNGYHGFGLKSMRYTARKYGGYLTVKTEDGWFHLRILIPLNGSGEGEEPSK